MSKVNFDSLKNIKAPQAWVDQAATIPETASKRRHAFPLYRTAAAASLVLVSVVGLLTFLFFGSKEPIAIKEKGSGEVEATEANGSVQISDDGLYPSHDPVFPTVPQVVPTDTDGNPVIEAMIEPTTAKWNKEPSATEPTEKVRPTQETVDADDPAQKPTQAITPTNPPAPTEPPQKPTEDQGEVVTGSICFTAVFPASQIEVGEPIYFMYWEQGVESPLAAADLQAQYTVMDNGMVFALYEVDIITSEGSVTYEYQFYQNGMVLAQGTQVV